MDTLAYAGNEAARRYINKEIDATQAAEWLERYALMPRARAQQRVRFFDQYPQLRHQLQPREGHGREASTAKRATTPRGAGRNLESCCRHGCRPASGRSRRAQEPAGCRQRSLRGFLERGAPPVSLAVCVSGHVDQPITGWRARSCGCLEDTPTCDGSKGRCSATFGNMRAGRPRIPIPCGTGSRSGSIAACRRGCSTGRIHRSSPSTSPRKIRWSSTAMAWSGA